MALLPLLIIPGDVKTCVVALSYLVYPALGSLLRAGTMLDEEENQQCLYDCTGGVASAAYMRHISSIADVRRPFFCISKKN
ncbi:hypothetical protein RB195_017909 [Necator americanus]|uniref:Uncharacterized protein n=1 Tax=Necator americanus TaxID=51031 RepID=A0ABR1C7D6_NECAM